MFQRLCQILFAIICVSVIHANPVIPARTIANGSPYFNDAYKYANILLTSGRIFAGVKMRIDLAAQQTFIMTTNGVEANVGVGMVKEISYADTTVDEGIKLYKFQTGFPPVDKQTASHFYLVLAEGRCSFLKLILKKLSERKNDFNLQTISDYETYEDYYFFSKGVMKRWKKDKEFLLAELSDKQAEVNQFILANKINVKNQEQLIKLLNYYNSL